MNYMDMLLVILIIILIGIFIFRNKQIVEKKPAYLKKMEIVEAYKQQMQTLVSENKYSDKQLKEEKMRFIKKVNQELNKNIFFTQEEINKIIYELTLL